ncbi:MAG TPA: DUF3426 domain-containing protein [Candidatus Acidoferrum sp.]|nr:DUF3426 domain-containing protein [Candidatus Acidoferrum sp.]
MIVTCSACKTRYLTDPAALGTVGRMVRCAKCGHTWMQPPPADLPRRVDVISSVGGPPDASPPRFNLPAPYIPPKRRRSRLRAVLAVAAVVVIAVVGAGYFARAQIIETWPQAKRVYDLIGGLVNTSNATLDVGNLKIVHQPVEGMEVLVLQGEITNRGLSPQAVPALRATLFDADDKGIMAWTFAGDAAVLQPGETGRFRTRAISPPNGFDRTAVTFADNGSL